MPTELADDDIVATHAQAAANAREPLLVIEPLRAFLAAEGLDAPEDLSAQPIGDGHSNVTFALSTGIVLRRPPRGPLAPSTHDVLREARLLAALTPADVPTPAVLAVCEDRDVIGTPFYVMELIDGVVITDDVPAALDTPQEHARLADELVDGLVALHAVDRDALGLEGFGRPTGYLARQLKRFTGLWEYNKTREVPEVAQIGQWLADNLPQSGDAAIVHGDYRMGNVLFGRTGPARLAGIVDWEMATTGDPLADVGYLASHWRQAGDPPSRFSLQTATERPGFPTRRELVARYEERSGRSVQALDWYVTLAMWKSIVFMEGNYKRAITGTTDDPYLKTFGDGVIELAQRALGVIAEGF